MNPTNRPTVSLLLVAFLALLTPGWAQRAAEAPAAPRTSERTGQDEIVTLEAFTVTGSHIRRIEEERVLPVTLYDRDDLDVRAASTPIELLEYLPSAGETPINEEATAGGSARGDVASISLRSIGSANTLVLVNGRRIRSSAPRAACPRFPST